MSTTFTLPSSFSVVGSNQDTNNVASNLNLDQPGYVWRSGNLTTVYVIIDLGSNASYDTVALVGSNLRAGDQLSVQTGTTSTGTGSYSGPVTYAYTGTKSTAVRTKTIISLGSVRTERYLRLDITATAHPDGYVEAQRLVVGQAIATGGMDSDAEQSFEDRSVVNSFPGGETIDRYDTVATWKFKCQWIPDATWRGSFFPMLMSAGSSGGVLFIPDDTQPTHWQHEAIFGRFTSIAKASHTTYDDWAVEGTITALSP